MAIAIVSWASFESDPKDIAPVLKRFTIEETGSTSSIGTGFPAGTNCMRPRSVCGRASSTRAVYSLNFS